MLVKEVKQFFSIVTPISTLAATDHPYNTTYKLHTQSGSSVYSKPGARRGLLRSLSSPGFSSCTFTATNKIWSAKLAATTCAILDLPYQHTSSPHNQQLASMSSSLSASIIMWAFSAICTFCGAASWDDCNSGV
jgi:hypothetical protein